ncbi:hypothetical protein QRZ28_26260 [Raoultella ornithinolytica]|uniref:hypothetical protein n=1 Tax=Raoultella ornithinolytica TaxID=54291 RepID=UPI00255A80EF|nr:hypothetical protein [Raoultella ornithinolytica]MDL4585355.1 hypothetical protein [Raoultella ornithinolytica]
MRNMKTPTTGGPMVIGPTVSGKFALQSQIMHLFLARSDVGQIRDAFTDAGRESLVAATRQNTNIRILLSSGEGHDES